MSRGYRGHLECRFVPLSETDPRLTTRPAARKRSQFSANFAATLELLRREIGYLSGTNVVIEAGYETGQIRNDGWPRSTAHASHPGVVLGFRTPDGPLRAIGLTLELLRGLERYGVTRGRQQYRGWKALPAGQSAGPTPADAAQALVALAGMEWCDALGASLVRGHGPVVEEVKRRAQQLTHPDAGGSVEDFQAVGRLLETLRQGW